VAREYKREQIKEFDDLVKKRNARFGPAHLIRLLVLPKGPARAP